MSFTLIITDSSIKARTIGAVLRNVERDTTWDTISAAGVVADWPRKGRGPGLTNNLRPKFNIRNRSILNKVALKCTEADRIYIAIDDYEVAFHLKKEILDKLPAKTIKHMRLAALTTADVSAALERDDDINDLRAEARIAGRVIDRLIQLNLNDAVGYELGRAIVPAMHVLLRHASPGQTKLMVDYNHALFGDKKVSFRSAPMPTEEAQEIDDWLQHNPMPKLQREVEEDLAAPPPRPYSTAELTKAGVDLLGLKSIEIMSQAWALFDSGLITRPVTTGRGMNAYTRNQVLSRIKALAGDKYCGNAFAWADQREGIRPTDIAVDPSVVPKPVRPIYRLIWANALCSCSIYSYVRRERVWFEVNGREFETWAFKITKSGYDRLGMGIFLRESEVPDNLDYADSMFLSDGWPHEADYIEALAKHLQGLDNPAAVVKSLENRDYIRYAGSVVMPTVRGHGMLRAVQEHIPEMMSPSFFTQVEYRLNRIAAGEFNYDDVIPEYAEWAKERAA